MVQEGPIHITIVCNPGTVRMFMCISDLACRDQGVARLHTAKHVRGGVGVTVGNTWYRYQRYRHTVCPKTIQRGVFTGFQDRARGNSACTATTLC